MANWCQLHDLPEPCDKCQAKQAWVCLECNHVRLYDAFHIELGEVLEIKNWSGKKVD